MSCKIDFARDWELRYQGAESKLYFGLHSNNRCVIKHRFPKKYRHVILDKKITKERTKRERRIMEKIKSKSKILASYMPLVVWSDDCTILMTEISDSETVFNYIEREQAKTDTTTTTTTTILADIAKMIGSCVAELHNLGIIHGDLTTSNLLLCPESSTTTATNDTKKTLIVVPIDFGLSTGSVHPEERAVDLFVLERALLSAHFSDSTFFNLILDSYLDKIDEKTCEPLGKQKIIERLREVRARGRKADYDATE